MFKHAGSLDTLVRWRIPRITPRTKNDALISDHDLYPANYNRNNLVLIARHSSEHLAWDLGLSARQHSRMWGEFIIILAIILRTDSHGRPRQHK